MSVDVSPQLWPPALLTTRLSSVRFPRQVWGAPTALAIPAVGKALHLYRLASLPMGAWRGPKPLPTPRLLAQPDPNMPGARWFIGQHIEDWLIDGNALHLVTVRSRDTGLPLAVKWFPARMWHIESQDGITVDRYWLNGRPVPTSEVVHVRRGSDPWMPCRGWGIVEQHLAALDRVALHDAAERENLAGGGVPSVAVIMPNQDPKQEEVDKLGDQWEAAFGGPGRVPGFFPKGTELKPLSWSPTDQQATLARKMTLVDVANVTGIDAYWLGAEGSSHTYRSPAPEWLKLVRSALNSVLHPLEETWSAAWLPRGTELRFDRSELLRDDLAGSVKTMNQAVAGGLYTLPEARTYLGLDPDVLPDPPAAGTSPDPVPEGSPDPADPTDPDTNLTED